MFSPLRLWPDSVRLLDLLISTIGHGKSSEWGEIRGARVLVPLDFPLDI